MRMWILAGALLAASCASGGGIYPSSPDLAVGTEISNAEQALAEARAVGADSLASAEMASARQYLDNARADAQSRNDGRAAIRARQAAADAIYARAVARRTMAERQRSQAEASLRALPQGGS